MQALKRCGSEKNFTVFKPFLDLKTFSKETFSKLTDLHRFVD
jgi:hypothetical protein